MSFNRLIFSKSQGIKLKEKQKTVVPNQSQSPSVTPTHQENKDTVVEKKEFRKSL
jgi:hypothetical protein